MALPQDSEPEGHELGINPYISYLAITALAVSWLQKQPEEAEGTCGNAAGPSRRFHKPCPMGCRAVALPNSVRLIHNRGNLACCPDFEVRHYPEDHAIGIILQVPPVPWVAQKRLAHSFGGLPPILA